MPLIGFHIRLTAVIALQLGCGLIAVAQNPATAPSDAELSVDWSKPIGPANTVASVYIVTEPLQRPGSPLREAANRALKNLGADYPRYMAYYTHPRLSVAELMPPTAGKTSWDFTLMDQLVLDFFDGTKGHPVILEFSTIPAWMFRDRSPLIYPTNPDEISNIYPQGTELIDPSGQQLADYYARVANWYVNGGFTDESGQFHRSGHHFKIDYWEVLNEPDGELKISPQMYTRLYDVIAKAVHQASPQTKFVGPALSTAQASFFEYFLDPKNHQAGTPLDMISYHGYATPSPTDTIDQWQHTVFSQADYFVKTAEGVESIRKRLSPATLTAIDEVGVIPDPDGYALTHRELPEQYWNLCAAFHAYLYMKLSVLGINMVHLTQLVAHPGFWPSLTLVDWNSGKPNARYWVLKLLIENFPPHGTLLATGVSFPTSADRGIAAQAFRTPAGKMRILLVNQRSTPKKITLPLDTLGATVAIVDQKEEAPRVDSLKSSVITLAPFAVAVVTLR